MNCMSREKNEIFLVDTVKGNIQYGFCSYRETININIYNILAISVSISECRLEICHSYRRKKEKRLGATGKAHHGS